MALNSINGADVLDWGAMLLARSGSPVTVRGRTLVHVECT